MIARLVRAAYLLNKAVEIALVPIVTFFFGVVFLAVLSRYVFGTAIVTSIELTRLSFIWACFLAAAIAYHRLAHVRFTLAVSAIPGRAQAGVVLFVHFAALLFAYLMVTEGYALYERVARTRFPALGWSQGWLYLALPVSGALIALQAIAKSVVALAVTLGQAPEALLGEGPEP